MLLANSYYEQPSMPPLNNLEFIRESHREKAEGYELRTSLTNLCELCGKYLDRYLTNQGLFGIQPETGDKFGQREVRYHQVRPIS